MKLIGIFSAAIACVILTTPLAFAKPLKKESQFRDAVVGKKLTHQSSDKIWVTISADGKMKGVVRGNKKLVGAWAWSGKYWCRNIVVGGEKLPEDCQTVSVDGSTVTFTRNKGKGDPSVWAIK